jgi:secreted PhoX family phosphatase
MSHMERRDFLRRSALAAGGFLAPSLTGLLSCATSTSLNTGPLPAARPGQGGYGALLPSRELDGIISIPRGFRATLLSTAGEEMVSGFVPNAFDGMAAFAAGRDRARLVRNHEVRDSAAVSRPFGDRPYDDAGPGGTTTVEVRVRPDGEASIIRQFASLTGTCVNCAGGPTPWNSWISCEETVEGTATGRGRNHGYAFEVAAESNGPVTPVPLRAMGRFEHEAVAVDPATGWLYLTEDRTPAGFYRFTPAVAGQLAEGGTLEALAIVDADGYDSRVNQSPLTPRRVRWVTIDNPDSDEPVLPSGYVYNQGLAKGAAQFARLEGCWYGDNSIYFNATTGGNAGAGQVWQYHLRRNELQLVFESPSPEVLSSPDNICVSPRGGIVICEDGIRTNFVRGLTREGLVFDLVRNNLNRSEWAGACFSPQGRTLFVNLQGETSPQENPGSDKGMTFAIWGPWESGAL